MTINIVALTWATLGVGAFVALLIWCLWWDRRRKLNIIIAAEQQIWMDRHERGHNDRLIHMNLPPRPDVMKMEDGNRNPTKKRRLGGKTVYQSHTDPEYLSRMGTILGMNQWLQTPNEELTRKAVAALDTDDAMEGQANFHLVLGDYFKDLEANRGRPLAPSSERPSLEMTRQCTVCGANFSGDSATHICQNLCPECNMDGSVVRCRSCNDKFPTHDLYDSHLNSDKHNATKMNFKWCDLCERTLCLCGFNEHMAENPHKRLVKAWEAERKRNWVEGGGNEFFGSGYRIGNPILESAPGLGRRIRNTLPSPGSLIDTAVGLYDNLVARIPANAYEELKEKRLEGERLKKKHNIAAFLSKAPPPGLRRAPSTWEIFTANGRTHRRRSNMPHASLDIARRHPSQLPDSSTMSSLGHYRQRSIPDDTVLLGMDNREDTLRPDSSISNMRPSLSTHMSAPLPFYPVLEGSRQHEGPLPRGGKHHRRRSDYVQRVNSGKGSSLKQENKILGQDADEVSEIDLAEAPRTRSDGFEEVSLGYERSDYFNSTSPRPTGYVPPMGVLPPKPSPNDPPVARLPVRPPGQVGFGPLPPRPLPPRPRTRSQRIVGFADSIELVAIPPRAERSERYHGMDVEEDSFIGQQVIRDSQIPVIPPYDVQPRRLTEVWNGGDARRLEEGRNDDDPWVR